MINSYMKEGKIIPVKVTAGLLKQVRLGRVATRLYAHIYYWN